MAEFTLEDAVEDLRDMTAAAVALVVRGLHRPLKKRDPLCASVLHRTLYMPPKGRRLR